MRLPAISLQHWRKRIGGSVAQTLKEYVLHGTDWTDLQRINPYLDFNIALDIVEEKKEEIRLIPMTKAPTPTEQCNNLQHFCSFYFKLFSYSSEVFISEECSNVFENLILIYQNVYILSHYLTESLYSFQVITDLKAILQVWIYKALYD